MKDNRILLVSITQKGYTRASTLCLNPRRLHYHYIRIRRSLRLPEHFKNKIFNDGLDTLLHGVVRRPYSFDTADNVTFIALKGARKSNELTQLLRCACLEILHELLVNLGVHKVHGH